MTNKVSVIIPARNERYLIPTITEVFTKAKGEIECVAVLEGYWPEGWGEVSKRFPNLHTIHHSEPKGMRPAINAGAASAISRGAKYLFKLDAHCMLGEGFDEILKADLDKDWVVVPRRKRLDVEAWKPRDDGRPDIDYHFLSFPDNPQDFGGPGLNGKVWIERARERFNKPEYMIDDEMSSQGSGWFMHAEYFDYLELMDDANYGKFWNEFQEIGLKCWLGGGRVIVNKNTWYAHWHKGSAGRGYSLPKEWLNQGATFTKRWLFNEAWNQKQTRNFEWIIDKFWPVPTWPENWRELIYGGKTKADLPAGSELVIHSAQYGTDFSNNSIDVSDFLRSQIVNGSLDVNVTNEGLQVGNPFRGQRKTLWLTYSYDGEEPVVVTKQERDWLVIGKSARYVKVPEREISHISKLDGPVVREKRGALNEYANWPPLPTPMIQTVPNNIPDTPLVRQASATVKHQSAVALIDLLIRRFNVNTHRLRGTMPIEVPSFHRNDLAALFAELGFNRGAEIGVAEGNYSLVLCQANPNVELLCVDPWHHYSGNPQGKSKEKNEYAFNETKRKLAPYSGVTLVPKLSMDAVQAVPDLSLDFVYIDGHHGFDYVMCDLIEWSKKVRVGGIVAGDDFYYLDPKRWGAGPVEAVQAYTSAHQINPWFIFNAHKSVDFCWVKQ